LYLEPRRITPSSNALAVYLIDPPPIGIVKVAKSMIAEPTGNA
jgi:hypothetical protein